MFSFKQLFAHLHKHRYVIGLVALGFVVYWRWIAPGVLVHSDLWYQFAKPLAEDGVHSIWSSSTNYGTVDLTLWRAPTYDTFMGIAGNIFGNFALAERLVILWPTIVVLPFASYLLLNRIFNNKLCAVVGSIVFSYNTYFLAIETQGQVLLVLAAGLCMLSLYFFELAYEKKRLFLSVVAALTLTLAGTYDLRFAYMLLIIVGIRSLIELANKSGLPLWKKLLTSLGPFAVTLVIFSLSSMYWLLPFGAAGANVTQSVSGAGLFGNNFWTLQNAITLQHPFWNGHEPTWFMAQEPAFFAWLIPVLAVAGLIMWSENPVIIYFAIVAVIGVFLTKQVAPPFGAFYPWLFSNLPGFDAFREATKFFFYIAAGYAVLLAAFVKQWAGARRPQAKAIGVLAAGIASALFLINTVPVVSGSIGSMFIPRQVPTGYIAFKQLIEQDSAKYFRDVWFPSFSSWSYFSNERPGIGGAQLVYSTLVPLEDKKIPPSSPADAVTKFSEMLNWPFAQEIFSMSGVKYFAVPSRDIQSDADLYQYFGNDRQVFVDMLEHTPWLHRVDLGTSGLAVFENPTYKPYFSALTGVVNLASLQNLEQKYSFFTGALGHEFAFAPPGSAQPGTTLTDPFEAPTRNQVNHGAITASVPSGAGQTAYINTNQYHLSYQVAGGQLQFIERQLVGLRAGGQPLGPQVDQTKVIDKTPLHSAGEFMLGQGSALTPIDLGDSRVRNLGTPAAVPVVYSVEAGNRVQNPQFENGLWRRTVEDCNNYDDAPLISMKLVDDDQRVNKVLELTADRHTACTGPDPVAVKPGETLMVSFDYRVKQGKQAGYQLVWGGGQGSVERHYLPVTDNGWRTARAMTKVPAGATSLRLLLESLPGDQRPVEGIARYANVRVSGLTAIDTPPVSVAPQYATVPLPAGAKTISVADPTLSTRNLIANPSLENGLWQPNVGDCNAYDNNADIGMKLDTSTASAGRHSLELTARRHIACTGPPAVPVQEGHTYLLSVDYQSPNAKSASIAVAFNDPNHSRSGNTAITVPAGGGWHTFNQTFTAPFGATQASITLSASAVDPPVTTIINRYDNLNLVELPVAAGQYYLVGAGPANLRAPAHITFTLQSPTQKLVHITGASTPFYLGQSEAYHPGWRLELNNSAARSSLPWAHPKAVGANNHFALDDFLNGWYVDPAALCHSHAAGCTVNRDGTYNLELVAEFTPQRWFNLGLIISAATLLACVGYLGWAWRARRGRRKSG